MRIAGVVRLQLASFRAVLVRAAVDDPVLRFSSGEEEETDGDRPGNEEEVEEEGEERKEDGEADVLDRLARLRDHLGGHPDPLHAAAKSETKEAGQCGEDDCEDEPESGAAHDHLDETFPGGQEDVVLLLGDVQQCLVPVVRVDGQDEGEADGADEEGHPDGGLGTAGEQENPGEGEKEGEEEVEQELPPVGGEVPEQPLSKTLQSEHGSLLVTACRQIREVDRSLAQVSHQWVVEVVSKAFLVLFSDVNKARKRSSVSISASRVSFDFLKDILGVERLLV